MILLVIPFQPLFINQEVFNAFANVSMTDSLKVKAITLVSLAPPHPVLSLANPPVLRLRCRKVPPNFQTNLPELQKGCPPLMST